LSRRELADAIDVSVGQFDKDYRRFIPKEDEVKRGRQVWLKARTFFLAWRQHWITKVAAGDPAVMTEVGAGTSPELERFRRVQADLKELELARQREELIPLPELREGWSLVEGVLLGLGDSLERDYGPEARVLLVERIREAGRIARQTIGMAEADESHDVLDVPSAAKVKAKSKRKRKVKAKAKPKSKRKAKSKTKHKKS